MRSARMCVVLSGIAVAIAVVACTKKTPEPVTEPDAAAPAKANASATASASAPRPGRLKVGESCANETFNNNSCELRPGCDTKCLALFDDKQRRTGSHCFLIAPNGQPGSSPCVADIEGTSVAYHGKEGAEKGYACDVLHNDVYCELTSHICTKTKPVGADCKVHVECGKDGACDSKTKKCIASAAAGAKCTEYRCASSAYCDRKANLCMAKKPDGASCGGSDECSSIRCSSVCMPAQPPDTCAL